MGPADCLRACFGQPEMLDLALPDQFPVNTPSV